MRSCPGSMQAALGRVWAPRVAEQASIQRRAKAAAQRPPAAPKQRPTVIQDLVSRAARLRRSRAAVPRMLATAARPLCLSDQGWRAAAALRARLSQPVVQVASAIGKR